MPSSIVRFRPAGPWRFGPDSGARDRVDPIYHSDSLFAAVTSAMLRLGMLQDWLDVTVRRQDGEPEVRFSSLFPFQRDTLFVTPPCSLWPPPPSTKIRFKSARFVPVSVVQSLVSEQSIDENRWIIDGESQCMIPSGEGPFRIGLRAGVAVDRVTGAAGDPHATACLEFGREAGLWTMVVFSSDEAEDRWKPRVRSALRLLADSGFGGERSRGWGRSADPQWNGSRDLLRWSATPDAPAAYWLLSVYAPAASDGVDWKSGNYGAITRTGRAESNGNWGALKQPTLMIGEGSVLVAPRAPKGEARDVAPQGFPHPVYRAGFAVTIPIPWRAPKPHAPEPPAAAKPVAPPSAPEAPSEPQSQATGSEPEQLAPKPETQPLAPEPQPEHLAPAPEPLAPEPEPERLAAEPHPEHLSPEPEPHGLAPEAKPEPLAPTPQPEPLMPASPPEPDPGAAPSEPHTESEPGGVPKPEPDTHGGEQ